MVCQNDMQTYDRNNIYAAPRSPELVSQATAISKHGIKKSEGRFASPSNKEQCSVL